MKAKLRNFLAAASLPVLLTSTALVAPLSPAVAQSQYAAAIKVNDQAITHYELEQRALLLTLFRAPGDPNKLAREQLIEDRLKLDAARTNGLTLEDADINASMEEFAGRANMDLPQFIQALAQAGVHESSLREFVRAGVTWRELVRARFGPRVSVSETDLDRARASLSGKSSVRVLLSEIIIPVTPENAEQAQQSAANIAQIESVSGFSQQASQVSASGSRDRGGQLDWMSISDLPPAVRSEIIGLAPGEVTNPLPIDGAIALFQLRDIEETGAPERKVESIEYAAYYIAGGRTEQALARAQKVKNNIDVCDDLYGIAKDEPPEVLERGAKAPADLPQDIAVELAKLDQGEVSTNLTRANGQTLVLLMMCGRTFEIEGEGPSPEQLTGFIRSSRLESFADGYLEQLRAEARIVEIK
ncbi:peptidylprolyl isomerase [Roseovarius sp. EL26]|uniref:peptidylprolyl isomerase n=1 Tax=Roseovarius sp. EL26 TaxID=2126672 RepID=UPI0020B16B34|nr:peptidylprolyl isomerase [Roseovarius sp. EL26]